MPKFYYKVIIPNTDIWYLTLVICHNIWLYYKLNTFKNICIVIIQGAVLFTLPPSFLFCSELGKKFVRPQHLIFKYHELLCMDLWQVMAQLSKDLIMKYQTDIMVVLKKSFTAMSQVDLSTELPFWSLMVYTASICYRKFPFSVNNPLWGIIGYSSTSVSNQRDIDKLCLFTHLVSFLADQIESNR